MRIHDPHVVAPLGWAGEDDRVLFTMPVIRGGSVATLVGDYGALPPLLVAEVLRQILAGLAAVHAAGIIHRDIKPANILLDATGTARPHAYVSDFGIAVDQRAPRWTEPGPISGTPGYLAPELESRGDLSPAIDLYAVGQVALTMVSGLRPGDRLYPARPADCPDSLWRVVQSLTAVDPGDRPGSALDALDLLADPELAWTASAMGDVEVFEHVSLEPTVPTRVHAAVGEEPPAPPLPPALVSPSAPTSNPVPSPAPAAPPPPGPPTAPSPPPAAPGAPAAPGPRPLLGPRPLRHTRLIAHGWAGRSRLRSAHLPSSGSCSSGRRGPAGRHRSRRPRRRQQPRHPRRRRLPPVLRRAGRSGPRQHRRHRYHHHQHPWAPPARSPSAGSCSLSGSRASLSTWARSRPPSTGQQSPASGNPRAATPGWCPKPGGATRHTPLSRGSEVLSIAQPGAGFTWRQRLGGMPWG
ncbi:MAG: serine/threonine-protein kinase [Dermatophilaceae bacterium]